MEFVKIVPEKIRKRPIRDLLYVFSYIISKFLALIGHQSLFVTHGATRAHLRVAELLLGLFTLCQNIIFVPQTFISTVCGFACNKFSEFCFHSRFKSTKEV